MMHALNDNGYTSDKVRVLIYTEDKANRKWWERRKEKAERK